MLNYILPFSISYTLYVLMYIYEMCFYNIILYSCLLFTFTVFIFVILQSYVITILFNNLLIASEVEEAVCLYIYKYMLMLLVSFAILQKKVNKIKMVISLTS